MAARTLFLSRLIGLYCLTTSTAMMLHRQSVLEGSTMLLQNNPVLLLLSLLTLVAGLALVLAHNDWTGGSVSFVVTLIAWIVLLKALVFLVLPARLTLEPALKLLSRPAWFDAWSALVLVAGLYLTWAGFGRGRQRSR